MCAVTVRAVTVWCDRVVCSGCAMLGGLCADRAEAQAESKELTLTVMAQSSPLYCTCITPPSPSFPLLPLLPSHSRALLKHRQGASGGERNNNQKELKKCRVVFVFMLFLDVALPFSHSYIRPCAPASRRSPIGLLPFLHFFYSSSALLPPRRRCGRQLRRPSRYFLTQSIHDSPINT